MPPMVDDRSRTPPIADRRRRDDQLLAALFEWTPPVDDRQPQPRSLSPPLSSKEPRVLSLPTLVGVLSQNKTHLDVQMSPSSASSSVNGIIRVRSTGILVDDTAAEARMRAAVKPNGWRHRRWLAAGMLGHAVDDDDGDADEAMEEVADETMMIEVASDKKNDNDTTDAMGEGASSKAQLDFNEALEAASSSEARGEAINTPTAIEEAFILMAAAVAPPMEEPATEAALVGVAMGPHEAHHHLAVCPSADEATLADRLPADAVDCGDDGDIPPSEAEEGPIQDSLADLFTQDSLAPELPAGEESLDSQCTLIEHQMELERIQAEAHAEACRVAELERLQAEADAKRLDAMESARDAEYDKAMWQNVPIHWGCIMDDMIFATADEMLSIAIGAIDGVGSTGQDFYLGATSSPIHRWLGGETSRGYMKGHCESWSEMKLICITPPGQGGPMERALIRHAKTYSCQCRNRADDNRGMSSQCHCFLYIVFGAV